MPVPRKYGAVQRNLLPETRQAMPTMVTTAEKKTQQSEPKSERKPQRTHVVDDKFKIFCGTANTALADEVCAFLGMPRGQALVTRFRDGEAYIQIQENRSEERRVGKECRYRWSA